jgi:divalent metal cation (Fe/Co/Zn/Cd) transporter
MPGSEDEAAGLLDACLSQHAKAEDQARAGVTLGPALPGGDTSRGTLSAMESTTLPLVSSTPAPDRERLVRRARFLAGLGLAWHGFEAAVAIAAGVEAGSIALVGFGADSLVEAIAGVIVLWRFAGVRVGSEVAELRAQKLIGLSFHVIAAYVGFEAVRTLIVGHHPDVSYIGIALSIATLATMPPLAIAKARVGERLGSSATKSEGRQNMLCAYLSGALLIGLGANAVAGWWWADPVTALVIAGVAVNEGREAWRGESCCIDSGELGKCTDDCC